MTAMFATWLLMVPSQPPVEPEAIARSLVETTRTLAEAVGGIKDEKSAAAIRPKLNELEARFVKLQKQLAASPEPERIAAELRWKELRKKQDDALLLAHDRIFAKEKPAYRALADTALFRRIEKGLEDRAILLARTLEHACKVYNARTATWPANLLDLVTPPDGGRSFVSEGVKALSDPWGAPFRFEIKENEFGLDHPYVWTVSPYSDGKKVLGNKPPKGKK